MGEELEKRKGSNRRGKRTRRRRSRRRRNKDDDRRRRRRARRRKKQRKRKRKRKRRRRRFSFFKKIASLLPSNRLLLGISQTMIMMGLNLSSPLEAAVWTPTTPVFT